MADFDRTSSIRRLTGSAFDRVTFDADLATQAPDSMPCGLIFVHAFWAGTSLRALSDFCDSLLRIDAERRIRFVICDIDKIPPRWPALYSNDHSGGNGDAFWVCNGRVVARHTTSRACDFDTANRSLLHCCSTRVDATTATLGEDAG